MDRFDVSSVTSAPMPMHVADKRPTADAAALSRNTIPQVPLPVGAVPAQQPSSPSQSATVSRSLMLATGVEEADKTRAIAPAPESQRLLKPYGLPMLPDDQSKNTASQGKPDVPEPLS